MYDFRNRLRYSAILPIVVVTIYLTTLLFTQFTDPEGALPVVTILYRILYVSTAALIAYVGAVMFFSLETIIRLYMTTKIDTKLVLQRTRARSFGKTLETLQKWDMKDYYKITQSVIFQTIILILAFYAAVTQSALVGRLMVLSILLLMFIDQGKSLLAGSDIQRWYWQVTHSVKRDTQLAVFAFMLLVYVIIVWMNLNVAI